jgi:phage shock protein C
MNSRRLYRCRRDRQLAGVAAGMAEYLDLDPTLVRVLWIVSAFFGGFTILLYLILAFVMPPEPETLPGPAAGVTSDPGTANPAWPAPAHDRRPDSRRAGRAGLYAGIVLVVFGAIALANALVPGWAGVGWSGPALLVALGVALLAGSIPRDADKSDDRPSTDSKEEEGHATSA